MRSRQGVMRDERPTPERRVSMGSRGIEPVALLTLISRWYRVGRARRGIGPVPAIDCGHLSASSQVRCAMESSDAQSCPS